MFGTSHHLSDIRPTHITAGKVCDQLHQLRLNILEFQHIYLRVNSNVAKRERKEIQYYRPAETCWIGNKLYFHGFKVQGLILGNWEAYEE